LEKNELHPYFPAMEQFSLLAIKGIFDRLSGTMPNRLLKAGKCTPEEISRLNKAFELASRSKGLVDRDDPLASWWLARLSKLKPLASASREKSPKWR